MVENKSIMEQSTNFHKIIDNLENIKVTIDDNDNVSLLLSSLPRSSKHLKDTILYGRNILLLWMKSTQMRDSLNFRLGNI